MYHIAEIGIWLKFQSEFLKNSDAVLYYTGLQIMEKIKNIFTYCEFIQLVRHITYNSLKDLLEMKRTLLISIFH